MDRQMLVFEKMRQSQQHIQIQGIEPLSIMRSGPDNIHQLKRKEVSNSASIIGFMLFLREAIVRCERNNNVNNAISYSQSSSQSHLRRSFSIGKHVYKRQLTCMWRCLRLASIFDLDHSYFEMKSEKDPDGRLSMKSSMGSVMLVYYPESQRLLSID